MLIFKIVNDDLFWPERKTYMDLLHLSFSSPGLGSFKVNDDLFWPERKTYMDYT